MRVTASTRRQLRIANVSFILLFLLAIALLQWLSQDYHWQFDWTRNGRYSLSDASIATLKGLDKAVLVRVFAGKQQGQRKGIGEFIARYQKYKHDINVEFIDPYTEPEQLREAGLQQSEGIIIEYEGAKETLVDLSEENFTNALTRLGHRGERWLVFLSGHGERSPDGQANFDLSSWANEMSKRGFKTRALQLSESPQIPKNTTALIIAGPKSALLKGEVTAIQNYVDDGGNILWLVDSGKLQGLQALAEKLGIEFHPGMIVDPTSQVITGSATAIAVANYGNHPIVNQFAQLTLLPTANALQHEAPEGWQLSVLFDTRTAAWSETGNLKGKVDYNKGKDIPGPLDLGVAMSRKLEDEGEQRVVVVGDGDFLSNGFLGYGGNLDLSLSLINWLSRDDAYVNIPVRTIMDRSFNLSLTLKGVIGLGFLVVLPLALAGAGITLWWRRRKG